MTTKFLALISVIGLASICLVQGQSPTRWVARCIAFNGKTPHAQKSRSDSLAGGESCIAFNRRVAGGISVPGETSFAQKS